MRDLEADESIVSTGNPVIDTVLNFKFSEAEQQGVRLKHRITIPQNLEIDGYHLSTILSNALDNAVRAALQVTDPEISFIMRYDRNRVILQITNPYCGEIERKQDGLLQSTKQSREHGLGLSNIRRAVEYHHGRMDMTFESGVFRLFILLYADGNK